MAMGTTDTRARYSRYRQLGVDVYPHQYFDPSSDYIPHTVKELYRWCRFFFLTNSTIGPIIRKKAAYVITDIVYGTTNPNVKAIYKELLEKTVKIKEFEYKLLLDLEVYGNAFCSIIWPFERYLVCPHCKYENLLRSVKWEFNGSDFMATCKNCKSHTSMNVKDKPIRNRSRVRLQRWFPQYIDVRHNPLTGKKVYILRLPNWLKAKIKDVKTNKVYVEDTPKEFLEALKRNKNIEFDPENLYHMRNDSVSQEDDSFGIPSILGVIKDAWLQQTYRRAQEAIALDHVLPMTMLTPAVTSAGMSPHQMTDLRAWQSNISNYISRWRRDQNSIFTVPFPMQVSQIRGDAQALNVHNDITLVRQSVAGGLDVPADFIYGGLTWTGGNVTLRVLENLLINRLTGLNNFLDWVVARFRRYFGLPLIKVHHSDFKMADDIQQKQIALGLRQTNTISDQTTIEELGFDPAKEKKRRREEMDRRLAEMELQQVAQAEIQGRVAVIQARTQLHIQEMHMKAQQKMQAAMGPQIDPNTGQPIQPGLVPPNGMVPPNEVSPVGQPQEEQMAGVTAMPAMMSPEFISAMAQNVIKSTPPHELPMTISMLKETNPILARAIEDQIKMVQDQVKNIQALPEQKPPNRSPENAVI